MISKDNLVNIGYIARPHSFKGEVQIVLDKKVALVKGDFLFLCLQGQYIPYKIEGLKGRENEPLAQLQFVRDFEEAKSISGNALYLPLERVQEEEQEISLVGFSVFDATENEIGPVVDVQELPQQIILFVEHKGQRQMIPLVEDFIVYISQEEQRIVLDLPEGLLDINV